MGRRRPSRRSARLRLTLSYGGLAIATGAVLLTVNYLLVRRSLTADPDAVRAAIEARVDAPVREVPSARIGEPQDGPLPDGLPPRVFEVRPPASGAGTTDPRATVYIPLEVQQGAVDEALHRLLMQSGIAMAVMALASLGIGWLMAGRALSPVRRITATARRLSETTLHERIDLDGPHDELKELADTFDAMLGRLERAFTAQRDFVANAAHELLTPLAIMRTEVDVTLDDPDATAEDLRAMAAIVRDATERSEQLVSALLTLAMSGGRLEPRPVDLAKLVAGELDRVRDAASRRRLSVRCSVGPAVIVGDVALLRPLVCNLLENAVRHNVDGGWLSIHSAVRGRVVELRVANSGSVMPPAEAPLLFRRFHRYDRSRSRTTGGFGLGLSIVEAVVEAHAGTVSARALPEGGLELTLRLPGVGRAAAAAVRATTTPVR
jgi:signal transduction histidine kinase